MRALSAVFLACVASAELCIRARSVAQSSGGAISVKVECGTVVLWTY